MYCQSFAMKGDQPGLAQILEFPVGVDWRQTKHIRQIVLCQWEGETIAIYLVYKLEAEAHFAD